MAIAVDNWSYGLDDVPSTFADASDGMKRVIRPIFNAMLVRYDDRAKAIAVTIQHLEARGMNVEDDPEFDHEEE